MARAGTVDPQQGHMLPGGGVGIHPTPPPPLARAGDATAILILLPMRSSCLARST